MTISLCMIVRDEEPVLARCLESVRDLVEEIVVVDTGSRDNTRQIAARYAHKVLEFPWVDDFAAARNFAFDQGEGDYLFWLDGDDLLLEEDRERFRALRRRMEEEAPTVVMLPYHTAFDRDGNPTFSYYRERLIRRDSGLRWKGRIHEAISPAGTILYGDAAVTHRKEGPGDLDRNLRIFEKMKEEGEPFGPREQFYYGRELYYHGRYEEAARELEAFFRRPDGWIENRIESCRTLSDCLLALGRREEAVGALLCSFSLDLPRAEICCDLGKVFLEEGRPRQAAYWYETALSRPREERRGGFVQRDCYGYLPAIQLCVCWDRLGDRRRSVYWNDRAEEYKPGDPICRSNREYFRSHPVQGQ